MAQMRMIKEIGDQLSRTELLASYRRADDYVGDQASQSDQQALKICGRIVIDKVEVLYGTLEAEVKDFEVRLIAQALERHSGNVTGAARELGITRQGLARILEGRHGKTLAGARQPKRVRRKSIIRKANGETSN
jgi:transcriptional regulator with GAF, ATPase, and Fis domain